jgi:hypothetical protein
MGVSPFVNFWLNHLKFQRINALTKLVILSRLAIAHAMGPKTTMIPKMVAIGDSPFVGFDDLAVFGRVAFGDIYKALRNFLRKAKKMGSKKIPHGRSRGAVWLLWIT